MLMSKAHCSCDCCQKFSPLCEKISSLLDENENKVFDELIGKLMNAETDAVFWKEKFYGTWPSDGIEEIRYHIKRLTERIEELESEKDYKNSLKDQKE